MHFKAEFIWDLLKWAKVSGRLIYRVGGQNEEK
jgi:hypothetical protein